MAHNEEQGTVPKMVGLNCNWSCTKYYKYQLRVNNVFRSSIKPPLRNNLGGARTFTFINIEHGDHK